MENPATWGLAERTVNVVLRDHYREQASNALTGNFAAGLSLTRRITDALREAGLLKEDTDGPVH